MKKPPIPDDRINGNGKTYTRKNTIQEPNRNFKIYDEPQEDVTFTFFKAMGRLVNELTKNGFKEPKT